MSHLRAAFSEQMPYEGDGQAVKCACIAREYGGMDGLGIDRAVICTIFYTVHSLSTFQCTRKKKKKKKASEASAKHAGWGWGGEQVSRFTLAFSQSRDFLRAFNDRMRMREN